MLNNKPNMLKIKTILCKMLRYKDNRIYNYIIYKLNNFTIITINNIIFIEKHFYILTKNDKKLIKKRYRLLLLLNRQE